MFKFNEMLISILDICKDGGGLRQKELASKLAVRFNLSEEERKRLKPSGSETILMNRTGWAVWTLKGAGFVRVDGGIIGITAGGADALRRSLSPKEIRSIANERRSKSREAGEAPSADLDEQQPEEAIKESHDKIRQRVESELLDRIMKNPPEFFERLVVQLMRKMGYGIDDRVTGRSGDGGIDGVIKIDKLGFDEIYLQAKRQSVTVTPDQVRSFTGTLIGTKSKRGVFITTSDFSKSARDHVDNMVGVNVIPINGKTLAQHMYDHGLGVSDDATYHVRSIDEGFFQAE